MKRFFLILSTVVLLGFVAKSPVYAQGCTTASDCIDSGGTVGDYCYRLNEVTYYQCERNGDGNGDSEGVGIDVEGSWAQDVFGDALELNIMKPLNFWNMEGTASIWSLVAFLYSFITIVLFVGFLFAVGIGALKWISSQGQEAQVQSAQKWMKNAVMGLAAIIIVFIIVSFISLFFGIGSIFEMGQNLAVCGDSTLYEYKNELREDMGMEPDEWDCVWRCPEGSGGWVCE